MQAKQKTMIAGAFDRLAQTGDLDPAQRIQLAWIKSVALLNPKVAAAVAKAPAGDLASILAIVFDVLAALFAGNPVLLAIIMMIRELMT
jgi:hypothetical protein